MENFCTKQSLENACKVGLYTQMWGFHTQVPVWLMTAWVRARELPVLEARWILSAFLLVPPPPFYDF